MVSLEPRHAESILAGRKTVEFRRRSMNIVAGTTLWMYAKVPLGAVIGCASITGNESRSPTTLWRKYGRVSGLSRSDFFDYFSGVEKGIALKIEQPNRLHHGLSLGELRRASVGFHPPQFYSRIPPEHPLYKVLASSR